MESLPATRRVGVDFGLWRSYSAVTVSPSGPRKLFKGVTTATSGVLARFPWLILRDSFYFFLSSLVNLNRDRAQAWSVPYPGR